MGQESPHKDKYPLYRGAKDDRSNLVIAHDRNLAQAMTYSQIALAMFVLGATIVAFFYLILEDIGVKIWIRVVICLPVLTSVALVAGKRAYLSWRHLITAQFLEEALGVYYTYKIKYKLSDRHEQFRKYNIHDEKLKQFRKRRYCLFLDKIFTRFPFKYI